MLRLIGIGRATNRLLGSVLLRRNAYWILVAAGILVGCDPVRTTSQNLTVIVESRQGVRVPGVKVRIKESWDSWSSWDSGQTKREGWESFYRAQWESDVVPWYEGVTNIEGVAVLKPVVTALDGTTGTEPATRLDIVSGREYIVVLEAQDKEDELVVVMNPGEAVSGKRYTLRIVTIEQPKYDEEKW